MSWSAMTTSNPITLAAAWQELGRFQISDIQKAVAQVQVNFQTDAVDNAETRILASIDGTNWDTVPMAQAAINNDQSPAMVSFALSEYPWFRIDARLTGSIDTGTTAKVSHAVGG